MNAHPQDAPRATGLAQSFNVFRRRGSDLACAVPLDRPVPHFLGRRWIYSGKLDAGARIGGFDHGEATRRADRHGFYLFRARA